ncbi:hypothetical protein [Polaribacter ponticola]|uniref:Uncharacterized protein n=1 Tax=Polaribacter ponticola TaxID=2978475 RepID=A0ABT5SCQ1_9FLAO|nr:hypothetical protein [Polaribacter sp. MSW5]MDD7915907.1 hypothetical protein [Polaribacter sp. MSW5]
MMKNLILTFILILFTVTTVMSQNISTATKNKVRVKFIAAEKLYSEKSYDDALSKINEIEGLLGSIILPTALNLKIKVLVGLEKYVDAEKELNILQNKELDEAIINDMAVYEEIISSKIKEVYKEKQRAITKQKAKEKEENRLKKQKEIFKKERLKAKGKYIDGLGKVVYHNNKYGVINEFGDEIIPFEYDKLVFEVDGKKLDPKK